MNRKTNPSIPSRKSSRARGYLGQANNRLRWLVPALLILLTPNGLFPGQTPTFQSLLTKDLTHLTPAVRFSLNDRIYLVTVWTGLKNDRRLMVHWVRPDQKIQETTRFNFSVGEGALTYRTWAWLSFKKKLWNLSSSEGKFIGPWKARLYLDDRFLMEYSFEIS
jgi:hypothetical protein